MLVAPEGLFGRLDTLVDVDNIGPLGDPDARIGITDDFRTRAISGYYQVTPEVRVPGGVQNLLDEEYLVSRQPHGLRPGRNRFASLGVEFDLNLSALPPRHRVTPRLPCGRARCRVAWGDSARQVIQPAIDLGFGLLAGLAVAGLYPAHQFPMGTGDAVEIILCELAPLLLHEPLHLFPAALDL